MTTVTLRMPEDVIDDLKRVAPLLGYSGYQPLMRAYIGQGLRADLARLLENLKAQGVSEETLTKALTDLSAGWPGSRAQDVPDILPNPLNPPGNAALLPDLLGNLPMRYRRSTTPGAGRTFSRP